MIEFLKQNYDYLLIIGLFVYSGIKTIARLYKRKNAVKVSGVVTEIEVIKEVDDSRWEVTCKFDYEGEEYTITDTFYSHAPLLKEKVDIYVYPSDLSKSTIGTKQKILDTHDAFIFTLIFVVFMFKRIYLK